MHIHQERESSDLTPSKADAEEVRVSINKSDLIYVRDFVEEDRNFIEATWLKGLRYGNDWFELIESGAYYKNYPLSIQKLMNLVLTEVKVACLKDSPDVVLAYSVYTGTRLHWVYCRKKWRNIGIARSLVPTNIDIATHLTETGRSILKKHPGIKFNPFF